MRVLHINFVYNTGSTGKMVYDIHSSLINKKIDSYVLYGRGRKSHDKRVMKISSEIEAKIHSACARLFGEDFGYSLFSTRRAISEIKKIKPDVIHLHCLNGHFVNAYKLIEYIKKSGIRTVLTLHAEIMHTAGCEHAFECERWREQCYDCSKMKGYISRFFRDDAEHCFIKMKKTFRDFENITVVSVSNWLRERAVCSPILKGMKHAVIFNGIDSNVFRREFDKQKRKELGIKDGEIVVFHVTPFFCDSLSHVKGGRYVLEMAERLQDKKIKFIIAGKCQQGLEVPSNVLCLGNVENKYELAKLYSVADVTLLTSKRETFSMVTAESLCCGTPVVGFKAGGPEQIALDEYSKFVEYGDIEALIKVIMETKVYDRELCSKIARDVFSKEKMINEYIKLYMS